MTDLVRMTAQNQLPHLNGERPFCDKTRTSDFQPGATTWEWPYKDQHYFTRLRMMRSISKRLGADSKIVAPQKES